MIAFTVIGMIVAALLLWTIAWAAVTLVVNVACGLLGALRIYRLAEKPIEWRRVLRMAFRHWSGSRFDGDVGTYLLMGGKRVSLDIRDPIYPEKGWGA